MLTTVGDVLRQLIDMPLDMPLMIGIGSHVADITNAHTEDVAIGEPKNEQEVDIVRVVILEADYRDTETVGDVTEAT